MPRSSLERTRDHRLAHRDRHPRDHARPCRRFGAAINYATSELSGPTAPAPLRGVQLATFFTPPDNDRARLVLALFSGDVTWSATAGWQVATSRTRTRRTTGLTRNQELISFWLARAKLGDHCRTYDITTKDDLVSHLRFPDDYSSGPGAALPMGRDSNGNTKPGFTVRDGNHPCAHWPGDAQAFARGFVKMVDEL